MSPDAEQGQVREAIPVHGGLPGHIAIIMDGNGRWASQRSLPRTAGHREGVGALRAVVTRCVELGIPALTVFAFSSENWRRPRQEVAVLMDVFMMVLNQETRKLHDQGVRLGVIGERSAFSSGLQQKLREAEALTRDNTRMRLTIAANYGGRWDIVQAMRQLAAQVEAGHLASSDIHDSQLAGVLSMADIPDPDLFIRTGGERRISNFLLWQMAYTELYFTDTLWPDFDGAALDAAIQDYAQRQRRFGRTGEQVASLMASRTSG